MANQFPTWKQIKIGTHKDAKSLLDAIDAEGSRVFHLARSMMTEPAFGFTVAPQERTADLVLVSPLDLGFSYSWGASHWQMMTAAREFGLKCCPAEIGPQLQRQLPSQPIGRIGVGMEGITNCLIDTYFFVLEDDSNGRQLSSESADDRAFNCKFVFEK